MDIFGKIIVGVMSWFNTLLGRSQKKGVLPQREQPSKGSVGEEASGDSVSQDIKNLKTFIGTSKEKILTKVFPTGGLVSRKFIGLFIKLILVIIILLTIVFIATRLFKSVTQNERGGGTLGETPTPLYYRPLKPSFWADDPEVKSLEEDINVLEREISGTNIKESGLNPPSLDYDINFEEDD